MDRPEKVSNITIVFYKTHGVNPVQKEAMSKDIVYLHTPVRMHDYSLRGVRKG